MGVEKYLKRRGSGGKLCCGELGYFAGSKLVYSYYRWWDKMSYPPAVTVV